MKIDSHVFQLFPTPLFVATYPNDVSEIVSYFESCPMKQAVDNSYGMISQNTYILDNKICTPLVSFFKYCFNMFARDIMRYKGEMELSQSWLTYKSPGQSHRVHTHPNTVLAGVFYYDVQPDDSAICFSKEIKSFNRPYIEPSLLDDYQEHPYSQEEVYFVPSQNNFIIFPSWLPHGVPPNKTNRVRKALGVNAIPKTNLGDEHTISEIKYSRYV
jgi:uncharacterized protein (TIGR02466 family)